MKKRQKNLIGLSGLVFVGGMTFVAVNLPAPEAMAANASVQDNITVRVFSDTPTVDISSSAGDRVSEGEYPLTIKYGNITKLTVTVTNRDANGNIVKTAVAYSADITDTAGDKTITLNLADYGGPGYYTVEVVGLDANGAPIEDSYTFTYSIINTESEIDKDTGDVYIEVESSLDEIKTIKGKIYRKGTLVREFELDNSGKPMRIPLDGLDDGEYDIEFAYLGNNNETVGTYNLSVNYQSGSAVDIVVPETNTPPVAVPDTGGLFNGLNISQSDYLITGLIVFFVLGVVALGVIMRNRAPAKRRRR